MSTGCWLWIGFILVAVVGAGVFAWRLLCRALDAVDGAMR